MTSNGIRFPIIIAFGYKRMRGKNTAADAAALSLLHRNMPFRFDSFAYSLKELCRTVFGFNDEQLNGELKGIPDQFWGFTPRWALQKVGTEAMRGVLNDIWVKTLVRRAKMHPKESILITDMRFPNEAAAVKELGGVLVRCNRDLPFDSIMDTHASETALDHFTDWDFVLNNNGTMDQLKDQVESMIKVILK
jgi:hypothetical protein